MANDKPDKTLDDEDLPYQQRPYIAHLRGKLANALAYGQETLADAARKELAAIGAAETATEPKQAAEARHAASTPRDEAPAGRTTRQDKQASAGSQGRA